MLNTVKARLRFHFKKETDTRLLSWIFSFFCLNLFSHRRVEILGILCCREGGTSRKMYSESRVEASNHLLNHPKPSKHKTTEKRVSRRGFSCWRAPRISCHGWLVFNRGSGIHSTHFLWARVPPGRGFVAQAALHVGTTPRWVTHFRTLTSISTFRAGRQWTQSVWFHLHSVEHQTIDSQSLFSLHFFTTHQLKEV